MFKKFAALALLCLTGAWHFIWNGIEGKLFDMGVQMSAPVLGSVTINQLLEWGPAVIFPLIGFGLFYWSWREQRGGPPALSASMITTGDDQTAPEYRAMFARAGSDAVFFIEQTIDLGQARDRPATRSRTYAVSKFQAKDSVSFPLIAPNDPGAATAWRFATDDAHDARAFIYDDHFYKGRVTIFTSVGPPQSCYFSLRSRGGERPIVTTETLLRHMFEWEGKEPPGGDTQSLFR